jgi:hypothetical protein
MKDRVPTYAGRVRLTPVTGQTNIYDLERADEPTEAGTPLSKANLLTDATATAMGLSEANATVNNALAATWGKAVEAKAAADVFAGGLRVVYQTYVGQGGASASVTFDAPPVAVTIYDIRGGVTSPIAFFTAQGGMILMNTAQGGNAGVNSSVSGNTLTWDCSPSASAAMNAQGATYHCIACLSTEVD